MNEWLSKWRSDRVNQRPRAASREPRAWWEGDRAWDAKDDAEAGSMPGGTGVLGSSYPLVAGYQAEVARLQEEQRARKRSDWERRQREAAKDQDSDHERWNMRDTNPLWSDSEVSGTSVVSPVHSCAPAPLSRARGMQHGDADRLRCRYLSAVFFQTTPLRLV